MQSSERSVSELLQDIVRNIQEIVRSEVRLAKAEVRDETNKAKTAAPSFGVGVLSGFFAVFFLLFSAFYGLSRVIPDWAAALCIAVVLAIVAGIALSAAMNRFKQVHATPERTIETIKENVEWARQQTK